MRHIVFSLFVLAFLVTACGAAPSDVNTDTSTDTTTSDTAAGSGDTAPSTESSASAERDFERAMGDYMKGAFSVDYTITMTGDGETLTTQTSQYFDGPERMRTDASAMGAESRTYIIDDAVTTCFRQDGEWSCMILTSGESTEEDSTPGAESLDDYVIEEGEEVAWTITKDGTKSVAGFTAECFRISDVESTSRYCIYDGVPLYMSAQDNEGGSYEMIATRYKKGVSASDFTFPAQPTEGFGGLGGFGGMTAEDFENMDWDNFDPSTYE